MKRFIFCLLILTAFSCAKITESDIPYSPVYLKLDLRYQDKDLVGLLNYKTYTTKRSESDRLGYSGVLVVNGYDGFCAFDLCCPHEASRSVVLVPDNTGHATCPQCETVYSTAYASGAPMSGPSQYPLRRYTVITSGQELIIQN